MYELTLECDPPPSLATGPKENHLVGPELSEKDPDLCCEPVTGNELDLSQPPKRGCSARDREGRELRGALEPTIRLL